MYYMYIYIYIYISTTKMPMVTNLAKVLNNSITCKVKSHSAHMVLRGHVSN